MNKKSIKRDNFKRILRFKEALIQILIISLNSQFAARINNFLKQINNFFYEKLNLEFGKKHNIKITDLKKLHTFHWIFEFPEVFLGNQGFDIVLGNPPYLRYEDIDNIKNGINYKSILRKLYNPYDKIYDFSLFFVLRSLQIVKFQGFHSFIITNKWLRAKYGKTFRHFLKKNFTIKKVIDFSGVNVFIGPSVDTLIYFIKKNPPEEDHHLYYNHPKSLSKIEQKGYKIRQISLKDSLWNFINEEEKKIKIYMESVGTSLNNKDIEILSGVKTGFNKGFIIDQEIRNNLIDEDPKAQKFIKPLIRGKDIYNYYIEWDKKYIIIIPDGYTKSISNRTEVNEEEAEKLISRKIPSIYKYLTSFKGVPSRGKGLTKRDDQGDFWWELRACDYYNEFEKTKIISTKASKRPSFYLDYSRIYLLNTSYVISTTDKSILAILNSDLSFFYLKISGSKLSKNFEPKILELREFPIVNIENDKKKLLSILVDYMQFLKSNKLKRKKFKEIIRFLDKKIINVLVYEIYLNQKKDLKLSSSLIDIIPKFLSPIDFDSWMSLYSKGQFQNLSKKENTQFDVLTKKIIDNISQTYSSLINDKKVLEVIEKIKSHDWIKLIEAD